MSTSIVIASSNELIDRVRDLANGDVMILPGRIRGDLDAVRNSLDTDRRVIFIEAEPDPDMALSVAEWAREHRRHSVLLVTKSPDSLARRALQAGVVDVVGADADLHEFRHAMQRALRDLGESQCAAASVGGRVITVASPKGGVGKTTVASNIAVGIARLHPERVVLVDLDVHFGDVASVLNLRPEYGLPDTIRPAATGDMLALKSVLVRHETGLFVVPGAESPSTADQVTFADARNLIDLLATSFDYVIIDTSPGLCEHLLSALDVTTDLVLVSSLGVSGIRGLRREVDTLRELGILTSRRHLVVNFADSERGLSIADVEATLEAKVDVVLPPSKQVPLSANVGVPMLQSDGRDKFSLALVGLVEALTGERLVPPRRSVFRRS